MIRRWLTLPSLLNLRQVMMMTPIVRTMVWMATTRTVLLPEGEERLWSSCCWRATRS